MSPLDWALVETWKNAGVPLEAVIRGIDAAFERWRSRRRRTQTINGLAWCAQAVMDEAERMAGNLPVREPAAPPFSIGELRAYLTPAAALAGEYAAVGRAVSEILAVLDDHYRDLEQLEQRLTALEDKLIAIARSHQSDEDLLAARQELARQLAPYRGRMSADQLIVLEKQFLDRWLFEKSRLPRLSLFYLK
jgi:predicted restriction endonuclease